MIRIVSDSITLLPLIGLHIYTVKSGWRNEVILPSETALILYAAEGKSAITTSSTVELLHEGELLYINFHDQALHIEPVMGKSRLVAIYFTGLELERTEVNSWEARRIEGYRADQQKLQTNSVIKQKVELLEKLWNERTQGRFALKECTSTIQMTNFKKMQGACNPQLQICWLELLEAAGKAFEEVHYNVEQFVQETIEEMDERAEQEFQVEQLAKRSGVAPTVFYQQFKAKTSLSPLQYVTKKRIDFAKQLLAVGNVEVREVAEAAGYPDIYYFNRVFKKTAGVPPYRFQKAVARKIAVLSPALYGNLLALGAAQSQLIPYWDKQQQKISYQQMDTNERELEWLSRLKPDLIVGTDHAEHVKEQLEKIAPSILLKFKPSSWQEHLLQLAAALGIEEAAAKWLSYYEQKALNAGRQIHERLGRQTVLAVLHHNEGYRVFGSERRKIGQLLYHDLQLNAPKGIEQFMFKDVNQMEQLNEFDADHILLFQTTPSYIAGVESLQAQIHFSGIDPWFHYSAYGHERSVELSVKYFG